MRDWTPLIDRSVPVTYVTEIERGTVELVRCLPIYIDSGRVHFFIMSFLRQVAVIVLFQGITVGEKITVCYSLYCGVNHCTCTVLPYSHSNEL